MDRIAKTTWESPEGGRKISPAHGGRAGAWEVLVDVYQQEDPEKSYHKAWDRASKEFGNWDSPGPKAKLLDLGWVFVDDAAGWEHPVVMSKDLDGIVRAEDMIMNQLSKGPVVLVYSGGGSGVVLSMDDVEATGTFAEAIDHAKQPKSVQSPDEQKDLASYDLGPWGRLVRRISFFR